MSVNDQKHNIFTWRERFRYWFDNHVASGIIGLVKQLVIITFVFAFVIAVFIISLGFNDEQSSGAVFWNSFSTMLNAEMPSYEDGGHGYILLMSISAVAGIMFTSVLIGIITSAIEEKINEFRIGNPKVVEEGHTVVLGFTPGEYTLIEQLIKSEPGQVGCLVVAENMERDDMLQYIKDNIEIPKSFKIVCRKADITDPKSIKKCSLESSKTVIVSPTDDAKTVKAVLAASKILQEGKATNVRINALISKHRNNLPEYIKKEHGITALSMTEMLARIIAHSCTQSGLADTFREIFNFDGSELYLVGMDDVVNMSFEEVMLNMDEGVPVGVFSDHAILNPPKDYVIHSNEKIIVFAENANSAKMVEIDDTSITGNSEEDASIVSNSTDAVIIGRNDSLSVILNELPENVARVYLVGEQLSEEESVEVNNIANTRQLEIVQRECNVRRERALLEIAKLAEHILILSDYDIDEEEADMEVIFLLMNLRDIRKSENLKFNITAEMRMMHNQDLVAEDDHTDFVVTSRMSSLLLAQLAQNPGLIDAFKELLSNEGNELYLKSASEAGLKGKYTTRYLRKFFLEKGYILLGKVDKDAKSKFNSGLSEMVEVSADDNFIVIGEK